MAHPWHHAVSSARKWGGVPEDYVEIHSFFDQSKSGLSDFRHRAMLHHTEGIFLAERVFGVTVTISAGKQHTAETCPGRPCGSECDHFEPTQIPVRWVGEQHVQEDLGCIPSLADWVTRIGPQPWMNRSRRLSRELEQEVKTE